MNGNSSLSGKIEKLCPFMSKPATITPPPNSVVTLPGGAVPIQIVNMEVACAESRCPVWDGDNRRCGVRVAPVAYTVGYDIKNAIDGLHGEIANIALILSPPDGSPSPTMRLADAIEELVELTKAKAGKS